MENKAICFEWKKVPRREGGLVHSVSSADEMNPRKSFEKTVIGGKKGDKKPLLIVYRPVEEITVSYSVFFESYRGEKKNRKGKESDSQVRALVQGRDMPNLYHTPQSPPPHQENWGAIPFGPSRVGGGFAFQKNLRSIP